MRKTLGIICLLKIMIILAHTSYGQSKRVTTPEDLFGHLIGSAIDEHPHFKKEYAYGSMELGMVNIGQGQELFGVKLEPEIGFAFYHGKLCSISFEYRESDCFDTLTRLLGLPKYAHTYNEELGELYSFVWEGNKIKISYPVFVYGPAGSQYITVEDVSMAERPF